MAVKRGVKYVITKLDGAIGASRIHLRHTAIFCLLVEDFRQSI